MLNILRHSLSGNFFTRYFERVVADVLPRRLKRVFYVSSALSIVVHDRTPNTETLSILNRIMKLGYTPGAMLFPAWIGSTIWKDLEMETVATIREHGLELNRLHDKDFWHIAVQFAEQCPDCLQYGSFNLMVYDIHNMLKIVSKQNTLCLT